MQDELIIFGKNNPGIDPVLQLWNWPIALYLFLGGLAAGILVFSTLYFLWQKENKMPRSLKLASILVPIILIGGLGLLFLDLHNKPLFWRLYTTIKWASPMSWGAWTLLIITPLSLLWPLKYFNEEFNHFAKRRPILCKVETRIEPYRRYAAWIILVLAVVLGVYTGILLSAFNARPLWNTSILGILFLVSGLSTAAVLIGWISRQNREQRIFRTIDLGLIGLEVFLIIHFLMGLLSGPQVQVEAAQLFLGGPYTFGFWGAVVCVGLLIPAILEILELKGKKIPSFVVPIMVLTGGLLFRMIIISAGQISSFTY